MAQGDVTVFNKSLEYISGTIDLSSDSFKLAICDNTVAPTATTATPNLSDFTEVGTGGTYVSGGTACTVTWSESGGTVTCDVTTNPSWAQDAGNDSDAYWGILYSTTASNAALLFVDLGGPVDMTAGDLTVTWNASGAWTLSH